MEGAKSVRLPSCLFPFSLSFFAYVLLLNNVSGHAYNIFIYFSGSMMARRFARTNVLEISFAGFTWMMFFMISLYSMINGGFWVLGYDPTWAGSKASHACVKIKWMDIYRDMLVENVIRASGLIMGKYLVYHHDISSKSVDKFCISLE